MLSIERDELGINAGLQDRVIQAYSGTVYMDFSKEIMDAQGFGTYVQLGVDTVSFDFVLGRGKTRELALASALVWC